MKNKFKIISDLFFLFPNWLAESPSIVIMWVIAIAGSFGQILYVTWFESPETVMFYFLLLIFIIVIPTTIASIIEFRNKLRDKSPVKTKKPIIYALIIAGLVTGLITIELVSLSIEFNLFMTKSTLDVKLLEGFELRKEIGEIYSLYIVPPYLFGMVYWIKKLKFN